MATPQLLSYDLLNKKRDLSDVLSTVIAGQPRFISLFGKSRVASNVKHEWIEDAIAGRSLTATTVSGTTVTASAEDVAKLKVGTTLTVKGGQALLKVASLTDATHFEYAVVATHGDTAVPATDDVLNIIATPVKEGSRAGDGETSYNQQSTEYNTIQIFRKEIEVTNTAMATGVYGNVDNAVMYQTKIALDQISRDMNRQALFGTRIEGTAAANGQMGGIYEFGTQANSMFVDASNNALDSFIVNDASQQINAAGANPNVIICSPAQARVISNEYKKELTIMRQDQTRGAYVITIVNEVSGGVMTVFADPDMPDSQCFVADSSGFGMSALKNNALQDKDATAPDFDGVSRIAI